MIKILVKWANEVDCLHYWGEAKKGGCTFRIGDIKEAFKQGGETNKMDMSKKIELKKAIYHNLPEDTPQKARALLMRAVDNGIINKLSNEISKEQGLVNQLMSSGKLSLGSV